MIIIKIIHEVTNIIFLVLSLWSLVCVVHLQHNATPVTSATYGDGRVPGGVHSFPQQLPDQTVPSNKGVVLEVPASRPFGASSVLTKSFPSCPLSREGCAYKIPIALNIVSFAWIARVIFCHVSSRKPVPRCALARRGSYYATETTWDFS